MYWFEVVVNVPLYTTFTYKSEQALKRGQRVLVPFGHKTVVALVWRENLAPDIDRSKIKAIETVFESEPILNEQWCDLIDFCARYYHYPIGQTAFCALATGLRQNKPLTTKSEVFITLSELGLQQPAPAQAHKQKYALWQMLSGQTHALSTLKQSYPQAKKYIDLWLEAGWLIQVNPSSLIATTQNKPQLNSEQQQAVEAICCTNQTFSPFLLFGVTGSGKTEVYFSCIEQALKMGQQVLFLLPEISLTPQLLNRVQNRFGQYHYAVLHSQIADKERTQGFMDALTGQKQLIIGTRLAVFTPMHNLGLIVVDEEHDYSFKQEDDLRYHARDLALWRSKQAQCPVILGSATPSLESYHKAVQGQYRLLLLQHRANERSKLPKIHIEDVRRQKLEEGFSPAAIRLLRENHQKGGLSLVYLNRRGFAPALVCTDCGFSFGCPHCSAKMVLHKSGPTLRCHHCNFAQVVPDSCPSCGNQDLSALGQGTQRVEETLSTLIPQAVVARVDKDSTARKHDWEKLYQQIEKEQVHILVGTQMLAKGHDFAKLSLVIILNADGGLYSPDFRSAERLFSELMQVSGRAGRAEHAGLVLLQTQLPDHALFLALKAHSFTDFAQEELDKRQQFGFSPFGHSIAIKADAFHIGEALHFLTQVKNEMIVSTDVNVLGPAPAFMMRLSSRERAQLFLESQNRKALHQLAEQFISVLTVKSKQYKDIRWSIDVDPMAS
ncbi:primosomal protein N' [Neisseria sp. Ec49-e6-T10]|uniref:primosomal protein N' n=1 Tax=Neisseria sp. Ec49-e6-T10 TaxID=3140744 RepID=UPI003EBC7DC7